MPCPRRGTCHCRTPAPAAPHLGSPQASSSAAAAAREAAPHARRAAALRRALQPGEAPASAELGPSSREPQTPRQSRGRRPPRVQTRLLPQPPPRPPGPGWRHSPDDSRAAASWPPAARPSPPARGCCSRSHPGTLCAAGARSESLAESRWRRRGGRASQRASGGAAVRSRSSGALALTPHPGMEGESQAESTGSPPRLRRRGGGEGEK